MLPTELILVLVLAFVATVVAVSSGNAIPAGIRFVVPVLALGFAGAYTTWYHLFDAETRAGYEARVAAFFETEAPPADFRSLTVRCSRLLSSGEGHDLSRLLQTSPAAMRQSGHDWQIEWTLPADTAEARHYACSGTQDRIRHVEALGTVLFNG